MKHISSKTGFLCGLIAIFISQNLISQSSVMPFPVDGKWIYSGAYGFGYTTDPIVRIVLDTVVIGEHIYWQLGANETCPLQDQNNYYAFVREDSNKWYSYYENGQTITEIVDCDFNLEVNDTFNYFHPQLPYYDIDSIRYVVTAINSISFSDNITRRKWTLHPLTLEPLPTSWDIEWIEGIGKREYFGTYSLPGYFDLGGSSLQCFGNNQESSFPVSWPNAECCWIGANEEIEPTITVYPNPVTDKFIITSENNLSLKPYTWKLYNSTGNTDILTQQNFSSDQLEFDLSDIPNGVYTLLGIHEKRILISEKIVVCK